MGGPGRSPSALQLCQAYAGARTSSPSASSSSASAAPPDSEGGLWQFVSPNEVKAVGEIVKAWSQSSIDGVTARRHLQLRVLRPLPPRLPVTGAAGQRAGPDGRGTLSHVEIQLGSEGSGAAVLGNRGPAWSSANLQPPEAWAPLGGGSFMDLVAPWMNADFGASRQTGQHQVYALVDNVFGAQVFDDARGTALRALGLDGAVAMPEEVRASFREQADGIMSTSRPSAEQLAGSIRLDLVRLCLCIEVVRHVLRSNRNAPLQSMLALPGAWQQAGRDQVAIVSFVIGDGRGGGGNAVMLVGLSAGSGSPFGAALGSQGQLSLRGPHLEPSQLQERISILMQTLLAADGMHIPDRPTGLSPQDMDQHCPVATRLVDDERDCPICLEKSVAGETIRELPCSHVLHKECCEAWLRTADTCPMCRFKVRQRLA